MELGHISNVPIIRAVFKKQLKFIIPIMFSPCVTQIRCFLITLDTKKLNKVRLYDNNQQHCPVVTILAPLTARLDLARRTK